MIFEYNGIFNDEISINKKQIFYEVPQNVTKIKLHMRARIHYDNSEAIYKTNWNF